MTKQDFETYQTLLINLSQTLASLTEIEQRKTTAVCNDDLSLLNECMKQEQALTMKLRGYEKQQQKMHNYMGLRDVALSEIKEYVPQESRLEMKQTSDELRRQYELFSSAFKVARNMLECNLYQVQQVITELNERPKAGDEECAAAITNEMNTDLRV